MASILIVYASMSGNTEEILDVIKGRLEELNHDVTVEEIEDIEAESMLNYDAVLLGSYTWGDGELPYETEDFYDELDVVDISGKPVAVFGSGDTDYPKFCEAVDIFEFKLKECGAELIQQGLKIELAPESEEDKKKCITFAENVSTFFETKIDI
ncbi:flavodoxin [Bacillus solimangrovi]|uniref:Flavodoxin n=1 Tax=Bacillus solimangrovi TaxID=1305675 RepID=A0A1E5LC31_9BACI|nr:flavodoxin [Bacillus solimangrovi]OEH91559.1 flavodoxin [Bacillus solimangrovi]